MGIRRWLIWGRGQPGISGFKEANSSRWRACGLLRVGGVLDPYDVSARLPANAGLRGVFGLTWGASKKPSLAQAALRPS